MAWPYTAILSFALITLAMGRPHRNGLPASKVGLKASSTHQVTHNSQGQKIPRFMIKLYKTLIMGNDTDPSMLEQPVLWESDSVLSLTAKRKYLIFLSFQLYNVFLSAV